MSRAGIQFKRIIAHPFEVIITYEIIPGPVCDASLWK